MADTQQPQTEQPQQGGEGEGGERRGRGGFGRRGGRGRGRGGRGGDRKRDEEEWKPLTNLGRLVANGIITRLEEIYYHSIPIKEYQIIENLLKINKKELKEDVMAVKSVQKQTKAGQRTRFKCVVAVGDNDGHVGLGTKVAKEVQLAMKGAVIAAKLSLIPVRRGYWGNKIGAPHTVPTKVTGKCGSVRLRLMPAPRGTGIVGAPTTKKLLGFAGIQDCFSQSRGNTDTIENFLRATFDALYRTYKILTPDLWVVGDTENNIFIENHEFLSSQKKK
jgi:small subunit ribosomal protein S2e